MFDFGEMAVIKKPLQKIHTRFYMKKKETKFSIQIFKQIKQIFLMQGNILNGGFPRYYRARLLVALSLFGD